MQQGVRHQDQGPGDAPGGQQPVEDEAGLDGLAQPDFVGQQDPGGRAPRDLGGDVELMGDGADPRPRQTLDGRGRGGYAAPPGLVAQVEPDIAVEAPRQQALARPVEGQLGVEAGLRQAAGLSRRVLADIEINPLPLLDGRHQQVLAARHPHPFPRLEAYPAQRGIFLGVEAGLPGGGKEDGHPAALAAGDQSKAKVGLGLAEPALARQEGGHGRGVKVQRGRKRLS